MAFKLRNSPFFKSVLLLMLSFPITDTIAQDQPQGAQAGIDAGRVPAEMERNRFETGRQESAGTEAEDLAPRPRMDDSEEEQQEEDLEELEDEQDEDARRDEDQRWEKNLRRFSRWAT